VILPEKVAKKYSLLDEGHDKHIFKGTTYQMSTLTMEDAKFLAESKFEYLIEKPKVKSQEE